MASKKILEQKQEQVNGLSAKVKKAKGIVVLDYRGINVEDDTNMRRALRNEKIEYKVLKNSIVLRAMNEAGYKGMDKVLVGPTAVAMSFDDATAPARIISENVKKIPKISIKGGIVDGRVVDAKGIAAAASIPAKPVLIAQLLGLLTSPMRSLAVVLSEAAKKKQA